jgi:prepilin-type processing-associated H-X9-DG protein
LFSGNERTDDDAGKWNDGSSYPDQGMPDRHGRGGSVGLVDGHVEWWLAKDFEQQARKKDGSANRPSRVWCSPIVDGRH